MSQRFGRYELLRPLGRGGMAEVFLARYVGPEGFEKRLVIKRILPRLADDQRLLRMFFEEARTHVSLSHGNLVSVFDFGRVENDYFIAMEHVRGADLEALLSACRRAGETLPPSLVAYVGIEVCRALAYVHRHGFVHRDLSPRNVLVSVDGEVKLGDFGLVLDAARAEDAGVRGTLAYAAPEQARGERVDARSDLYSLGCVLAEAASGARVREAADDAAALEIARRGDALTIDGPLGAIVARATQPSPEARFAGADAMLAALEKEASALGVGREASVRELATRMSALVPASEPEPPRPPSGAPANTDAATAPPTAPARRHASSRETYYRGNESAAIVEEVLRPRRRRLWPLVVGGVAIAAAAGGISWQLVTRHRQPMVAARPQNIPPPMTPPQPTPPPTTTTLPPTTTATPTTTPPQQTTTTQTTTTQPAAAANAREARHHVGAKPAANGTLHIQCSPWCIPFVDGTQRGPDRKNHTLSLPAGRHVVEARRLDDKLERSVKIDADGSATVDFAFP